MGRKNFGKKKKNQQKKQKKERKSSKRNNPGIPQEQVTCREVAIYQSPDEESDQESAYDLDDPQFNDCSYRRQNRHYREFGYNLFDFNDPAPIFFRFFMSMLSEIAEQSMMGNRAGNRPTPSGGFNSRARR